MSQEQQQQQTPQQAPPLNQQQGGDSQNATAQSTGNEQASVLQSPAIFRQGNVPPPLNISQIQEALRQVQNTPGIFQPFFTNPSPQSYGNSRNMMAGAVSTPLWMPSDVALINIDDVGLWDTLLCNVHELPDVRRAVIEYAKTMGGPLTVSMLDFAYMMGLIKASFTTLSPEKAVSIAGAILSRAKAAVERSKALEHSAIQRAQSLMVQQQQPVQQVQQMQQQPKMKINNAHLTEITNGVPVWDMSEQGAALTFADIITFIDGKANTPSTAEKLLIIKASIQFNTMARMKFEEHIVKAVGIENLSWDALQVKVFETMIDSEVQAANRIAVLQVKPKPGESVILFHCRFKVLVNLFKLTNTEALVVFKGAIPLEAREWLYTMFRKDKDVDINVYMAELAEKMRREGILCYVPSNNDSYTTNVNAPMFPLLKNMVSNAAKPRLVCLLQWYNHNQ